MNAPEAHAAPLESHGKRQLIASRACLDVVPPQAREPLFGFRMPANDEAAIMKPALRGMPFEPEALHHRPNDLPDVFPRVDASSRFSEDAIPIMIDKNDVFVELREDVFRLACQTTMSIDPDCRVDVVVDVVSRENLEPLRVATRIGEEPLHSPASPNGVTELPIREANIFDA